MEATFTRPLSNFLIRPCRQNAAKWGKYSGLAAAAGIVAVLSINPALPQAGVALVKVERRRSGLSHEQGDRQHRHERQE